MLQSICHVQYYWVKGFYLEWATSISQYTHRQYSINIQLLYTPRSCCYHRLHFYYSTIFIYLFCHQTEKIKGDSVITLKRLDSINVGTDVHKKMKHVHMEDNIFKKLMSPRVKLVDYSNQLYQ